MTGLEIPHRTRWHLPLSIGQKITLITGMFLLTALRSVSGASQPADDATQGKLLFQKRCSGCHSLDQDKEGPRLGEVYGRKAGTVQNFPYSVALQSAHVIWDSITLDKWLANPDSLVVDNDMAFHVPDAEERGNIIRYLKQSSGQ